MKKLKDLWVGEKFVVNDELIGCGCPSLDVGDVCSVTIESGMTDKGWRVWFETDAERHTIFFVEGDGIETKVELASDLEQKPGEASHYRVEGMPECIDIINGLGLNFELGNAMKYLYRQDKKGSSDEDLQKAKRYIEMELERRGRARR